MANLPTDMELELAESQRNATRTPSPQLTPCEQLKYSKAQLAKMETFRRCKQACVDAVMMMPDHHPDEPFYVRAVTELQDIEEAMTLAIVLENTVNDELNFSQNKFELPQGAHFNNLEDSGKVENENNPNGSKNSVSQNAPQTQLPPPIMLFVEKNYKAQMAAMTKAFPKIRSRLTGEFLKLYTDSAEERQNVTPSPAPSYKAYEEQLISRPTTPLTPEPTTACGKRRAAMTRLKNQETMIDGYQKFLATFNKGKDEHGVYKQLQESLTETIEARDSLVSELRTMPPCLDQNCPDHTKINSKSKIEVNKSPQKKKEKYQE
ncbi:uncharacterized protein TNCV_3755161 [Trichonephila clavipes]|nr:uncharacterized protein TNCV_3755161 [Trichonephila clavipes]